MTRGFNFGAGPSMLPDSILTEVQNELLDWQHLGMSVLEIGHRSAPFTDMMQETEHLLRELLAIPNNYHVLFLSGAARAQFAMIPMNFLAKGEQAGYLITGIWSNLAYQEAFRLKEAYCITNGEKNGFTFIPAYEEWQIKKNSRYVYYTPNETVNGVRFVNPPKLSGTPLIADMTSCLLTEPINIDDFGLIFAGAQKNIANAGLTIVIVSEELLSTISNEKIPTMFDYRTHSSTHSSYATLPTFNCYLANKMFRWIKNQGGVKALYQINRQKAELIYNCLDNSDFYYCQIEKEARSLVNVCFTLNNSTYENLFLEEAKAKGLFSLKGHRSVGGLRASMYNAMPLEGAERLAEFMTDFARKYRK
ncbi:MAG: 3-phosphoserine/phosphohydroxythreonine transaminase [Tatlockia sp.]|nr:3-phosphoserine/phosphohydroxythreonine transaminase [Tatlockia sp.]